MIYVIYWQAVRDDKSQLRQNKKENDFVLRFLSCCWLYSFLRQILGKFDFFVRRGFERLYRGILETFVICLFNYKVISKPIVKPSFMAIRTGKSMCVASSNITSASSCIAETSITVKLFNLVWQPRQFHHNKKHMLSQKFQFFSLFWQNLILLVIKRFYIRTLGKNCL